MFGVPISDFFCSGLIRLAQKTHIQIRHTTTTRAVSSTRSPKSLILVVRGGSTSTRIDRWMLNDQGHPVEAPLPYGAGPPPRSWGLTNSPPQPPHPIQRQELQNVIHPSTVPYGATPESPVAPAPPCGTPQFLRRSTSRSPPRRTPDDDAIPLRWERPSRRDRIDDGPGRGDDDEAPSLLSSATVGAGRRDVTAEGLVEISLGDVEASLYGWSLAGGPAGWEIPLHSTSRGSRR